MYSTAAPCPASLNRQTARVAITIGNLQHALMMQDCAKKTIQHDVCVFGEMLLAWRSPASFQEHKLLAGRIDAKQQTQARTRTLARIVQQQTPTIRHCNMLLQVRERLDERI